MEEIQTERLEHIWQNQLQLRYSVKEKIDKKRAKSTCGGCEQLLIQNGVLALRQLVEKRKKMDGVFQRRDIIKDFANNGSRVYAALIRDGVRSVNKTLSLLPKSRIIVDNSGFILHSQINLN